MTIDRIVGAAALAAAATTLQAGTVCHVDDDAAPGGDGASWVTAHAHLQDALDCAAEAGAGAEIRVAGGTYRPDRRATDPGGTGDRAATFALFGDVVVRGGYLGLAAGPDASPDDRDVVEHPSILSGDLAGDDGPDFAGNAENCYHVVTVPPGSAPVLEGFVVTAGHADGSGADDAGAGLYLAAAAPTIVECLFTGNLAAGRGGAVRNNDGDPAITRCVFADNAAVEGGGLHSTGPCHPIVLNCRFENNVAGVRGGAMFNTAAANPDVVNCTFTGNAAGGEGGGMRNLTSHPTLIECTFTDNHATSGGGMANWVSAPALLACRFEGNTAERGAAMFNLGDSDATVTGCVFRGNVADGGTGGGMLNDASHPELSACLFIGNRAEDGGAVANDQMSSPVIDGCSFIANSADHRGGGMFSRLGGAAVVNACGFTGNTAGTAGGGLASTLYSTPEVSGSVLCGNAPDQVDGLWADHGGNRVTNACPPTCPPDVTGDGFVSTTDLLVVEVEWGPCAADCLGDVDGDGAVGVIDQLAILAAWGRCPRAAAAMRPPPR
jgi:hypothetical protein